MILCSFNSDGSVAIKDGNIINKFDKFGMFHPNGITMKDISNFSPYKVISVLTSCGEVTVGLFDESDYVAETQGNFNTVMNITEKGGYLRRVIRKGIEDGVSFTQVIFIYQKDFNLQGVI